MFYSGSAGVVVFSVKAASLYKSLFVFNVSVRHVNLCCTYYVDNFYKETSCDTRLMLYNLARPFLDIIKGQSIGSTSKMYTLSFQCS